jgi:mycothiol system anti-sigma-R factor
MTEPTDRWHCIETIELLYEYLDGELAEHHRVVIRRHLDDCPPCVDAFDFEASLRALIARRCQESPPPSLRDRVMDALRRVQE